MEIIVKTDTDRMYSVKEDEDITATDVINMFCRLMLSMGYHQNSIVEACELYAEENTDDK